MQVQASISEESPISFVLACIFSVGLLLVTLGQIGIYTFKSFKKEAKFELQLLVPLLLVLCFSGALLGVVVSKIYEKQQGVYIGLLLLIPNLSGLCELETLFRLSTDVAIFETLLSDIHRGMACVTIIAQIIGFTGSTVHNDNPQSVWIITLFTACGVLYLYLCLAHLFILLIMMKFRWIFFFQNVLLFLIFIPMAIFASSLGNQIKRQAFSVDEITASLRHQIDRQTISVWVLCSFSSILRFRLVIVQLLVVYERKAGPPELSFGDWGSEELLVDQTPTPKDAWVRCSGGTERSLEEGVPNHSGQAAEFHIKSEGRLREEQGNQVNDKPMIERRSKDALMKELSLLLGRTSPPPHLRSLDELALSSALEYMSVSLGKSPPATHGRTQKGVDESG